MQALIIPNNEANWKIPEIMIINCLQKQEKEQESE